MKFISGGQKSRVAFALLTYTRPHLIIMDEPTNHLDMDAIGKWIFISIFDFHVKIYESWVPSHQHCNFLKFFSLFFFQLWCFLMFHLWYIFRRRINQAETDWWQRKQMTLMTYSLFNFQILTLAEPCRNRGSHWCLQGLHWRCGGSVARPALPHFHLPGVVGGGGWKGDQVRWWYRDIQETGVVEASETGCC